MKYVKTINATNQIARKKLLDKFLKKHKIYLSFYRNTKQYSGFTVDRLIACRENPAGLIVGAFPWSATLEGFKFWDNIDYLWKEYYKRKKGRSNVR